MIETFFDQCIYLLIFGGACIGAIYVYDQVKVRRARRRFMTHLEKVRKQRELDMKWARASQINDHLVCRRNSRAFLSADEAHAGAVMAVKARGNNRWDR
jgi:hypothetical protein